MKIFVIGAEVLFINFFTPCKSVYLKVSSTEESSRMPSHILQLLLKPCSGEKVKYMY